MFILLQRLYPPRRKSLKRLRYVQKPSLRSRFSRRIHQNSQNLIINLRFLQRKRTQQIHQPRWSRRLRSRRLSRYFDQLRRRKHLRRFIIGRLSLVHGNRNRWRNFHHFNSQKHHYSRQKIPSFHHLRRQLTRSFDLSLRRRKIND